MNREQSQAWASDKKACDGERSPLVYETTPSKAAEIDS